MSLAIANWGAELVRFTGFLHPEAVGQKIAFQDLTGNLPAKKVTTNLNPDQPGWFESILEVGAFEGFALQLEIQLSRIDIRLLAPPSAPSGDQHLPNFFKISRIETAIPPLKNLVGSVTSKNLKFLRLAFGAVALCDRAGKVEAYQLAKDLIGHIDLDPEKDTDLLFQINRRREIKVDNKPILINRLSKWSAIGLIPGTLNHETRAFEPTNVAKPQYATRVEVDINTPAENLDAMSPANAIETFNHLAAFGLEIIEKGDLR